MSDVSPDLFLDVVLSYQKTAAIKAALALDLFTVVAEDGADLDRIASRTGASRRGVRILCDYLTVQGFMEKHEGRYVLTPATGMFLTAKSPAFMGSIVDFLASPEMISLWLDDPVGFVRKGGSEGLAIIAPDHPVWVKFAKAMVPLVWPVTQAVAASVRSRPNPPKRVLDVAAGHGMFGIALALQVPGAEITALDWKTVLAVAEENARAAGLSSRYHTLAGSAFETDWGRGFDLVLLTNFLHHFDRETCVKLLVKARQSLTPKGRVIAVDFVPNEDRVSPPFPAMFSFMMLGSTPSGDAYTAAQFEEMGATAGFARTTIAPAPPTPQSMIIFDLA